MACVINDNVVSSTTHGTIVEYELEDCTIRVIERSDGQGLYNVSTGQISEDERSAIESYSGILFRSS